MKNRIHKERRKLNTENKIKTILKWPEPWHSNRIFALHVAFFPQPLWFPNPGAICEHRARSNP